MSSNSGQTNLFDKDGGDEDENAIHCKFVIYL